MDFGSDKAWYEIKAALEARGTTLAEVARAIGLSPSAGRKVKTDPIPRVQAEIARVLGTTAQSLWPSRYHPDGDPLSPAAWKAATNRRLRHVQSAGAK